MRSRPKQLVHYSHSASNDNTMTNNTKPNTLSNLFSRATTSKTSSKAPLSSFFSRFQKPSQDHPSASKEGLQGEEVEEEVPPMLSDAPEGGDFQTLVVLDRVDDELQSWDDCGDSITETKEVDQEFFESLKVEWFRVLKADQFKAKFESSKLCSREAEAFVISHETEVQIEKDLNRALHGNVIRGNKQFADRLRIILREYVKINPAIGYCQGMNTIAAGVLLALRREDSELDSELFSFDKESALWIFCAMIEANKGYYVQNMCGLAVDQLVLQDLMVSHAPNVLQKLKELEVDVNVLTASWFICLFVECPLSLDHAWQIWDLYFEHGPVVLFETALAIFQLSENMLMNFNSQEEALIFYLQKLPEKLDLATIPCRVLDMHEAFGKGLKEQVESLREFHRMDVLNSQLNGNGYLRLSLSRTGAALGHSFEDILKLWQAYHEPDPWRILESGTIDQVDHFKQIFVKQCWSDNEIEKWRSAQSVHNLFQRMFRICTSHNQGQLSFVDFVKLITTFKSEDWRKRLPIAFAVLDDDQDGTISTHDAQVVISQLLSLYSGDRADNHLHEAKVVAIMLGLEGDDSAVGYEMFCENAPFVMVLRRFFQLEDANVLKRLQSRSKIMLKKLSL